MCEPAIYIHQQMYVWTSHSHIPTGVWSSYSCTPTDVRVKQPFTYTNRCTC